MAPTRFRQGHLTPVFAAVSGLFLLLVLGELVAVLVINKGHLVYTLDDPYIHLALAENLLQGHYGVNPGENSAPSSSIIWPFVIAPLAMFEATPLVANVLSSLVSLWLFVKMLGLFMGRWWVAGLSALLILITNMVGLVFTGMEHSLQVTMTLLVVYGMLVDVRTGQVKWWFLVALTVAPLVRYECLTVSGAALLYLALGRKFKPAILTGLVLIVLLASFSFFLLHLGLDALPNSVISKSEVVQQKAGLVSVGDNLLKALKYRQTFLLFLGALPLCAFPFFKQGSRKNHLAMVMVPAIGGHLLGGRFAYYHRYEIYIWVAMLMVNISLYYPLFRDQLLSHRQPGGRGIFFACVGLALTFAGQPYIMGLRTLPVASNNIHEQHYQMHRFAVDFFNEPVAVSDLGYVAYKNPNYVRDLWGLGAATSMWELMKRPELAWIEDVEGDPPIGLIMIYEEYFSGIPDDYIKVGDLKLSRPRITPAGSEVAFFAVGAAAYARIQPLVEPFQASLPPGVEFIVPRGGRRKIIPGE